MIILSLLAFASCKDTMIFGSLLLCLKLMVLERVNVDVLGARDFSLQLWTFFAQW